MGMNQANPNFNDAIEKYFGVGSLLASAASRGIEALEWLRVTLLGGKLLINERIVEYPMVFRLIKPAGKVLDVGCVSSRLPLQLASLGYEVHGVDLRPYPLTHASFTFHKVDLLGEKLPFAPGTFDIVLAVSCVEHFGLGAYGDLSDPSGDSTILRTLRQLLKPGGQLLMTCPFGKRGISRYHRIYDSASLRLILQGFTIQEAHFFRRFPSGWSPALETELADIPSPDVPVNGVAILDCRKRE